MISTAVRWRITGSLFLSQAFYTAAAIATFTLTAIAASELSGTAATVGVPVMALLAGRAAAAYPLGWIMDKRGRRAGLSAAYAAGVVGSLLGALAIIWGSFALFVFAALLFGVARGGAEQSRYVAAEVHPEDRRARMIGLVVFAGTAGSVGGPLLVSASEGFARALGLNELSGPWLAGAALSAMALAVTWALIRPDPLELGSRLGSESRPEPKDVRPLSETFRNPHAIAAVAAMTVGQTVMTMLMTVNPLHMYDIHYDTTAISMAMMAHTLGMYGLSWLTGRLVDRFEHYPMILAGAALLTLAGLLAPVAAEMWVITVLMFALGLGWNFAYVAGSSLLSRGLPATTRGRAQGVGETFTGASAALGALASGIAFATGGFALVGLLGVAIAGSLIGGAAWLGTFRRPLPA